MWHRAKGSPHPAGDNNLTLTDNYGRPIFAIFGALLLATTVSGLALTSGHVFATQTCTTTNGVYTCTTTDDDEVTISANASVTVSAACTMSATGTTHSDTIAPSVETTGIGTTNATVVCNDNSGYAIYAIGYSNNTYGNNTLIHSTDSSITIPAGTGTSSSNWSVKLEAGTGDGATITSPYGNYTAVPNTFTQVATYTPATAGTSGTSFTTTYRAYASPTQPAGTYTGAVKYVLVHPSTQTAGTYTISYNTNGGTGTMNNETGLYNFEEHTLVTNTLTAPNGYEFAGWCTVQDQTQSPQTTCTGISYTDADTIPASTVAANSTLTLYAYWAATE